MKIYTRGGDKGETSLFGGARVSKNHQRVSAYGDVDELNSCLGLAAATFTTAGLPELNDLVITIQNRLFDLGSELAASKENVVLKLARRVNEDDIALLEKQIDEWQEKLPPLKNFILPGGSISAAHLHLARTVCRRAERSVTGLAAEEKVEEVLLKYLNRLSDLLFVMARYANMKQKVSEPIWSNK